MALSRTDLCNQLSNSFDIIIIGGGATGLGAAVEAATRGYRTLLVEKYDFAKGTSSRSTKLVHGGVRYLQQGNIKLVMEALRERGILKQNAPHLVKNQSFIVPNYKWWEGPFYGLGLKVYDWMSGQLGLGESEWLSTEEVQYYTPTLDPEGLKGGVLYHDGQFDDSRLAINLAQTAIESGAVVLNYAEVTGLIKHQEKVIGVKLRDTILYSDYEVQAKVVINAAGVFSDSIQQMDDAAHETTIAPSQGIHIVLDKAFLPGDTAIMIPHTDDGRVLFAVPWHQKVIIGTTDTPVSTIETEPKPLEEEVKFVLNHAARYLTQDPTYSDIKSMFAGLRPLVKASAKNTAALSRDHSVTISPTGLVSIIGGKWTTYRKMGEDVINIAAIQAGLPYAESVTHNLLIHGADPVDDFNSDDYYYGSDRPALQDLVFKYPQLQKKIHPDLPYTEAMVVWAAREEYAHTVEDVLSRRTRALLLDAKASIEASPTVAKILAKELKKPQNWIDEQIVSYTILAKQYLPL
ncbi:MAG: glycerol-3-phosphate dehydrogenase/oxidase [Chitinophagaceae bacterium]|uniref:glycerol-3-phosphate dehydrogenase/oxidase n=1 Tax=unclassified Paraflavitalea TaxID=2798305 RepID=UPI003D356216|nr:glycerol-3-phosphate dehydrogenase/oxidase [Chitinophagaceae bacterium]